MLGTVCILLSIWPVSMAISLFTYPVTPGMVVESTDNSYSVVVMSPTLLGSNTHAAPALAALIATALIITGIYFLLTQPRPPAT